MGRYRAYVRRIWRLAILPLFLASSLPLSSQTDPDAQRLYDAASGGSLARVHKLIEEGINLNALVGSERRSPLMAAAAGGHGAVVKALLENGANATLTDSGGHTALSFAAESGDVESIEALLGAGAAVDAVDSDGWTPLLHAA